MRSMEWCKYCQSYPVVDLDTHMCLERVEAEKANQSIADDAERRAQRHWTAIEELGAMVRDSAMRDAAHRRLDRALRRLG